MNKEGLITSKTNQWIQLIKSVNQGKKQSKDYFLAEGIKVIETVSKKLQPKTILKPENEDLGNLAFPDITSVSSSIWEDLSDLDSPPKAIGIFEKPKPDIVNFQLGNRVLILDRIQDPGNMGTIIRTAVAFGWNNIICMKGTVDPYSPKVVRSTAGTIVEANLFTSIAEKQVEDLFAENEFVLLDTSSYAEQSYKEINVENKKLALVLGNEGQGSSDSWKSVSSYNAIKIPLKNQNVESLNVAVSAAILMENFSG